MRPPARPRRTLLQRFATSRASTLTSLLIALALHAALLSLAYAYYITTKPTELPDLPLPQGFATESADATPAHPTVTFTEAPASFASPSPSDTLFPDPVAKNLLKPVPTDVAPPQPPPQPPSLSRPDLALGTTDAPDFSAALTTDIPTAPARPARTTPLLSDAPGASVHSADAPANQPSSSTDPNTSATPQGTPDVPPTPSARNKVPPYPPEALRRRLAGTVVLELHIAATGRVTDAGIQQSSGHDLLDRSARDTALTWTFNPARLDGRPVPITVLRPVNFIPPR